MLSNLKIIDLSDEKGFLCGKILGDLGADVIKVEQPGGCPSRRIGPHYKNIPSRQSSLYWAAYNCSKRGITLNITTNKGKDIFKKLISDADLLIESFPVGYLDTIGIGYKELSKINKKLVIASISHFGQNGSYSKLESCDLVDMALGGLLYICGDEDRAPVRISFPQAYLHGGAAAAVASLTALYYTSKSGTGQHVDVSIQECIAWTCPDTHQFWDINRLIVKRAGAWRIRPATGTIYRHTWKCKDGYVSFWIIGGSNGAPMMKNMVRWMDSNGLAGDYIKNVDWDEFDFSRQTQKNLDSVSKPIGEFFRKQTKKELHEGAVKWRAWLFPVNQPEDILADPHLRETDFWQEIYNTDFNSKILYPGSGIKSSEVDCHIKLKAPDTGEHNREIYIDGLGFTEEMLLDLQQQLVI